MSNKPLKQHPADPRREDVVELETQFILRLPEEPAKVLREAVQQGANNIKDRLFIKIDNDMRYGEVRLDHWLLYSKVLELPTVIESLKTIDNKSFYKTADICQIMICKTEPDPPAIEEESPSKNKKKDPNKVDKKYLWPHGITPPCKNVRRRRFRKTLKKKYVEAPEIEKEVKRLLRTDNEAVNVKWEITTEEEPPSKASGSQQETGKGSKKKGGANKQVKDDPIDVGNSSQPTVDLQDIFGEELSSSDEEDNNITVELDESRLSADDSRFSDYDKDASQKLVTQFDSFMFGRNEGETNEDDKSMIEMSKESINTRIQEIDHELKDLENQRIQKEQEISSIENQTLRQRLQHTLDRIMGQIIEKQLAKQNYLDELQSKLEY